MLYIYWTKASDVETGLFVLEDATMSPVYYQPSNRKDYCLCGHLKTDHIPGPCYTQYCECCPKCQESQELTSYPGMAVKVDRP